MKSIRTATSSIHNVSVEQLIRPTSGFLPIHRGFTTNTRYLGATMFVDHFSDFTYAHVMTKIDGASTIEVKDAFERIASSHGVKIRHYHADNDLFETEKFRQSIQNTHQALSVCGVNAHHQNGKAERRIGDATQGTITSLLHAAHR